MLITGAGRAAHAQDSSSLALPVAPAAMAIEPVAVAPVIIPPAVRNAVTVDVGAVLFKRAQLLDLSGGFWYWHNEYGKPSSDPGAEQMTPMIGMAFHLDGGRANHRR